jgi:predicted nucleic acid-binding protein
MAIRIFVDTSFIIALVNERDQYHHQALSIADRYDSQFLVVTDAILRNDYRFYIRSTFCSSRISDSSINQVNIVQKEEILSVFLCVSVVS